jgi:hypothetical protein
LFGFVPDLAPLVEASQKLEEQVEEALADNIQMRAYLAELEKRIDSGVTEAATPDVGPTGDDLMGELEAFLKKQRSE